MMKWRKLGRIFETGAYAQTPTPVVLEDRVRVYYAAREWGKAFISKVDLNLDDPTKWESGRGGRVLANGKPGTFDCDGQMPSYAMRSGDHVVLYYSGWLAPQSFPYHNATGVAISYDRGETFERAYDGPILDRTLEEPYLAVTPCLHQRTMWYVSGLRWEMIGDRLEPIYVIRSAESGDGMHWSRDGVITIPQAHALECFSRPWVLRFDDGYRMWYSYRSAVDYRDGPGAYRIGYATSSNGQDWTRRDDEFHLEREEWDATMQCYPAVFKAKEKLYMLYNGSSFGRYGFGLAVAE